MKKFVIFLLLFCFCCLVYSNSTNISKKDMFKNAFQIYLNNSIKKMPLILFPDSKVSYLVKLRKIMSEEYFVVPKISEVGIWEKKRKYNIDKGFYKKIKFRFSSFLVKDLPFDNAEISFCGTAVDEERLNKNVFFIQSAKSITFTLEVSVERLGKFISEQTKKRGTVMPLMSAESNNVALKGKMKFLDFEGNVYVRGLPFIDKKNKMRFRIEKCISGKNSVPGFIVDTVSNIVNPLMKLDRFPYDMRLIKIFVKGEKLFFVAESNKFKKKTYDIKFKSKSLLKYLNKGR